MCTSKILGDSRFTKQKNKNKKYFCESCLQCFSSKNVLTKHKEVFLSINGLESVRLEKRRVEFKTFFKQIPVPFKVYTDFECNLNNVESYEGSYSKKYQYFLLLVVLLTNLFVLMIDLVSQLFFTEVKMLLINLLKQLKSMNTLKQYEYCKRVGKNISTKI